MLLLTARHSLHRPLFFGNPVHSHGPFSALTPAHSHGVFFFSLVIRHALTDPSSSRLLHSSAIRCTLTDPSRPLARSSVLVVDPVHSHGSFDSLRLVLLRCSVHSHEPLLTSSSPHRVDASIFFFTHRCALTVFFFSRHEADPFLGFNRHQADCFFALVDRSRTGALLDHPAWCTRWGQFLTNVG